MNITEQIQQLSQETVGTIAVVIGGGGTAVQAISEWANIFVTGGNVALIIGGLYLMYHKLFDKRRNRRAEDKS